MAGTNIVAARIALITALDALTGTGGSLEGVTVKYSYVAKYADGGNREFIYGGPKSESPVELEAMLAGTRIKRTEDPDWTLGISVRKPGQETTQAGDERAVALGAIVENYVAANPTLGVSGLHVARITGFDLNSYTDEKQSYSDLTYSLSFKSYLT